ncbi:MAG TPA: peptidylprolyl isomerase [Ottowia sp.]|jgi:peptidyl-prolyl cis-trans isomerase SurA|nr:MAG: molecular chaperone SurA [Burkholderiales bacterium 68-10]HMT15802.1 peptidylprolyl isomerase [Ottowia sp.]HMT56663.1 peptidylprolyl isomerase [Ottowia sp.]HMT63767.1 peptidylprolyl isomerase [Ottowia sp.]HMT82399.1 peptidylprolyl isomerase [Ottowia sp.]
MSKTPPRHPSAWALLLLLALAGPASGQGAADAAPSAKKPKATQKSRPAPRKAPAAKPAAAPAPAPASASAAPAAAASVPAVARPAASSAPREADYIVALVNSEPVTNQEVRARMARAQRQLSERGAPAPQAEALRQEILERLIAERAQLQYARETGLKVDAAALAQAELSIARQNQLATVAELHRRVEQDGIPVKDFQDDVRNQVLLARLREREIEPKLRVTDAEVDAFIREQTGATAAAIDLNLAMILVAVPEGSSAAELARLQARADEVARRARAGEDFAALALEFSDANNRGRDGGVLGLRPADRYPELFVRSVQRARVGDVVGPVKSEAGFHILKLLERKQNKDLPEVRIPQTHVRHILLRTGPAQSEQVARQRLADFKRRIEAGQANFEQLAREQSQDASAADGGDLGWAPPGQFVPEFEQAMNNLDPGQISEPVVSRFGVHLIRVDGRREQVLSSSEQRQLARNVLREKKAEEAFETWAREVRGRAYVEMREPPR